MNFFSSLLWKALQVDKKSLSVKCFALCHFWQLPSFVLTCYTSLSEGEWQLEKLLQTAQPEMWEDTSEEEEAANNSDSDHLEVCARDSRCYL